MTTKSLEQRYQTATLDRLRAGIELTYLGERGLRARADAYLATRDLGRSHYRVMYVVDLQPGASAKEILEMLQITPQSLAPVMTDLITGGYVAQETDPKDRRIRRHSLTPKGLQLHERVFAIQAETLEQAYARSGEEAVAGFLRVLGELSLVLRDAKDDADSAAAIL